ncbi:MAG: NAD(P)-dependent oxidoreductase [Boseongicola sp.]|nr:NAD(P)-dependent oxidoreductase [Boseongicola sp.]
MRILVTGGSGKAGRHVIAHLIEQGHRVLNVDLLPCEVPGVFNRIADITNSGHMYDAMRSYADFDELGTGKGMPGFDAVIHLAAIARIMIVPDNECYRVNTIGTYNVIDAALRDGVRKVIYASSETTYGICFSDGQRKPDYLPVDEEHATLPEDSYAMSKVANEVTAKSFQRRSGIDIYGMRLNNVIAPEEYADLFPSFVANPASRERNIFSYIDTADLGHFIDCALATNGLGYEVFNVSSTEHSVNRTSDELIAEFYPNVEIRGEIAPRATFYSNEKARRLLGYAPTHDWRSLLGLE